MFKKIIVATFIICLSLSIVGCSNTTINNKIDGTTTAETNTTVKPRTDLTFDLYDFDIASIAGNTTIIHGEDENFTPRSKEEIIAKVGYGSATDDNNSYNSEGLTFYIFESIEDANKAFEYIKNRIVQSAATVTDNYIKGLDFYAIDINIKHFYYKNKNMIIYHLDYIGDPGIDSMESENSVKVNEALHNEIMSIWNY